MNTTDSTTQTPVASWSNLSDQKIIEVKGPQAAQFLQGQLSCNMQDVAAQGSLLGSHNNIRGHMISLFRVMQVEGETFWLSCHESIADSALKTLKKYIIFSKATAELVENLNGVGIFRAEVAAQLMQQLGDQPLPEQVNQLVNVEGTVVVKVPGERFEIWSTQDIAAQLDASVEGDLNSWLLAQVRAGIPAVVAQTQEHFIPQMTNLQVFEGVSFQKGCYTGQEIITRLQHRGMLKKPMYRAVINSNAPVTAGSIIDGERKNIGEVVLSAQNEQGQCELLAVISKDQVDAGAELFISEQPTLTLSVLDLPYTLDPHLFESKR